MGFRFLTAGESHGPALSVTLDGIPAGLRISGDDIAADLARRQHGYGRGARMKIEQDRAEILAGVRHGLTLGSPILLLIRNRDWDNWTRVMQVEAPTAEETAELANLIEEGDKRAQPVTRLRPGHADLAGALKFGFDDVRNVLERASARETTARVAAGAVCRGLLRELGIEVWSFTAEVGGVAIDPERATRTPAETDESPLRCPDPEAEERMIAVIDEARRAGDTVGGVFQVVASGVPVGVGSYVQWDRRLDGALARAICSIQSIKGVEFGLGFEQTRRRGSEVHDVISGIGDADGASVDPSGGDASGAGDKSRSGDRNGNRVVHSGDRAVPVRRWLHRTNRAGGLTGGVSTGEPIVVRGAVKPISTLARALPSADLRTGQPVELAHYERSDVSVVPAAGVIGEAMVLLTLTEHVLEKFGGDSLADLKDSVARYLARTVRVGAATRARTGEGGEAGSGGDD